jgi:DNA-binding winged helix-turn-helix (wHTH) protein
MTARERGGNDSELPRPFVPSAREPGPVARAINPWMNVPTVYLLGEDNLELIPEYLQLGSVVVVAPDRDVLRRWTADQEQDRDNQVPRPASEGDLVVDLSARRVSIDGRTLNLTDLEFRVLAALMTRSGRAWSFTDLRRAGWGRSPHLLGDDQTVRALVQRLRKKLRAAGAPVTIEAVRSFGFRAEVRSGGTPAVEGLSLTGVAIPPSSDLADTQVS